MGLPIKIRRGLPAINPEGSRTILISLLIIPYMNCITSYHSDLIWNMADSTRYYLFIASLERALLGICYYALQRDVTSKLIHLQLHANMITKTVLNISTVNDLES